MKHEWKKHEKQLYLPKEDPATVQVPALGFYALEGRGNPNDEPFAQAIGVLYSLAYGVKMLPKQGPAPAGYFDYAVYPLEGVWEKGNTGAQLEKDKLRYTLMIRQPAFVDDKLAEEVLARVSRKKPHPLLQEVSFVGQDEGLCVQMLHLGPYDTEPESFACMDLFCREQGLRRTGSSHREIYLTDARKTAPHKLKTVLRYRVEYAEG